MKVSSWNIGILIQEGLGGKGLFCFSPQSLRVAGTAPITVAQPSYECGKDASRRGLMVLLAYKSSVPG